jgi:hypothetical protein
MLSDRELAVVVAALQQAQRDGFDADVADIFGEFEAMDAYELEALIERINTA